MDINNKTDVDLTQIDLKPEDFEFVQRDERIFDKKFETEPTGYFRDAFSRFLRNKTNVVATIILFTLILLSVFVPMLTTKNYQRLETQLDYLPPRVPLLDKFGILDGTKKYTDQPIDPSTYDPETNTGTPIGFYPQFIIEDTFKIYTNACTNRDDTCLGGENTLVLNPSGNYINVTSRDVVNFVLENNPVIKIDIEEITGTNATVQVLLNTPEQQLVAEFTTAGTHQINLSELDLVEDFESAITIQLVSEAEETSTAVLKQVLVEDTQSEEPLLNDSGLSLSRYRIQGGSNGSYVRENAFMYVASFRYDEYKDAFYEQQVSLTPQEYNQILEDNKDVCSSVVDPDNPDGLIFAEGCPIKKMINQTEPVKGPSGNYHYSYNVIVDYMKYKGYEKIPYFYFGTNENGLDYFALVFYGLRTSLIIGVIVSIINIVIGVIYGAIEGYYGGRVDLLMERFTEIIGRIPFLVWISLFVVLLGSGARTLIVLLTVTGWIGVASTTRAQFYRYKGREYVLAARTLGAKDRRIIFRHILPNAIGTLITSSILSIPSVIFTESTVSYLGFGIGHGQTLKIFGLELPGVSLGVLLSDGRGQLVSHPHMIFFPAVIISILMITFNMFGNALRDAFNPSLRGVE